MKAPLFIGAALLGFAFSRPAQAQVVNGTPTTAPGGTIGTPAGTVGTPGVTSGVNGTFNGSTVNGQTGVVPNTTPTGVTTPILGGSVVGGTLDGTVPAGQPLNNTTTMPRNATRRSTTTRATSPANSTTTPVRP